MGRRLVIAALALCSLGVIAAHAQGSSLGIGNNEAVVPSAGLFGSWMLWIDAAQQRFYRALTGAMKALREDGSRLWLVAGLSFAYGVFHAAGPGHGKAVISSYMLANEVALRRGVLLSFVSAFLQALTAIVLMGLVFLALRGTSVSMADAAGFLEVASYALITAFGAWLLARKARPLFASGRSLALESPVAAAAHGSFNAANAHHGHSFAAGHGHVHPDSHAHGGHAAGEVCDACGHSHAPDPALLSAPRFSWRSAWSAVAAVGLRPCSGALIVLSFAFLNGLWAAGVLSVLAMALGTGITVSALAMIAVGAKNWAVSLVGDGRAGGVHAAIEIGGAAFVLLLGLSLLSASLAG